ncbi:MAG: hypothetical protein ACTS2F_10740 [Thainema sp.]
MFINQLAIEGNNVELSKEVMAPTWEQVKDFILSLDAYNYSVVYLNKGRLEHNGAIDIEEFMSISGGGKNRLYTCEIYSHNDGQKVLIDRTKSDTKLVEIIRIFPTDVEENRCLKLGDILTAAETYARFGKANETLSWQAD